MRLLFKYSEGVAGLFSGDLPLESTHSPMKTLQMISDSHDSSVFQGGISSTEVCPMAKRTIKAGYWFTFRWTPNHKLDRTLSDDCSCNFALQ